MSWPPPTKPPATRPVALKHFMEVYGSNIDYRDVAERIKALKS